MSVQLKQKTIEYFDGEAKLISQFIYNENSAQPQPGIIIYPAFEGIAEFAIEYAQNLIVQGYACLVADIYGEGRSANTIEGCFELITPFLEDRALVRRRSELAFTAVANQDEVDSQRIGAIGFCFGGMCALELARTGANLKAAVLAHAALAKSPKLDTQNISTKLLVLHGYQDPQIPPQVITEFAQEMQTANNQDWEFTFFGDAKHSFTDPKTGSFDPEKEAEMGREYNPIVATRTFDRAVKFFAEIL